MVDQRLQLRTVGVKQGQLPPAPFAILQAVLHHHRHVAGEFCQVLNSAIIAECQRLLLRPVESAVGNGKS